MFDKNRRNILQEIWNLNRLMEDTNRTDPLPDLKREFDQKSFDDQVIYIQNQINEIQNKINNLNQKELHVGKGQFGMNYNLPAQLNSTENILTKFIDYLNEKKIYDKQNAYINKRYVPVNLTDETVKQDLKKNNTILYTNQSFETAKFGRFNDEVKKIKEGDFKELGTYISSTDDTVTTRNGDKEDTLTWKLKQNKSETDSSTPYIYLKIYKKSKENLPAIGGGKRRKTRRRNRKSKKSKKSRKNRRKSKRTSRR